MDPSSFNFNPDGDPQNATPGASATSENSASGDDQSPSPSYAPAFTFAPTTANPQDPADTNDATFGGPATPPTPPTRQPVRQIGQIPLMDDSWVFQRPGGPGIETPEQYQTQHDDWMRLAQRSRAQRQQIAQINQSDPYISNDDGRWKKQSVDPQTGAIHESDILDTGSGKTDRNTGDIYVQTAQGPQVIGTDDKARNLANLVSQRPQLAVQGDPADQDIANAKSDLADVSNQMAAYNGAPEKLQRAVDAAGAAAPDDPGAQASLKNAQTTLQDWYQQHPEYRALQQRQTDLTSQIASQQADKAAGDASVLTNMASADYVRMNGVVPPADNSPSPTSSDAGANDVLQRTADIAAQTGLPRSAAYFSALTEAKAHGAATFQGAPIDAALAASSPDHWLSQLTRPQLKQAFQAGTITRAQVSQALSAERDAEAQARATADNGVGALPDFAMRALSKMSSVVNSAGEGLSRWGAQALGQSATPEIDPNKLEDINNLADLANWFKTGKDSMNDLNQGKFGPVNPARNKSAGATIADAVGFTAALTAAATALAPVLPEITVGGAGEIGGSAVAGWALRLGLATYKSLPALALLAPAASADAYDQAKAEGKSERDATVAGMGAAAKQLPQILLYHGANAGIAALGQKFLPTVLNPILKGATRLVTGAAANITASTAVRAGEYAGAALGIPGMQAQPILPNSDNIVSDLAFAGLGSIDAAAQQIKTNALTATAQQIRAGTNETHQTLQRVANDPSASDAVRRDAAAKAANAEDYLNRQNSPNPTAYTAGALYDKATDARAKVASAQSPGAVEDTAQLGPSLDQLKTSEDQYHDAARKVVAQVPDAVQRTIYKAVAPDLDYDTAHAEGASSPVKYFGGLELGNAARDAYVPPDLQDRIQALAKTRGIDPALAGHVMDQAVGARAVRDLMAVVRGESIPASTAKALTDMGLLQNEGGATPLKVTDDALHLLPPTMQNAIIANPGKLRFTRTPGQPADAMNQIVDQGMERFANTAKRLGQPADTVESQPAPSPTQTSPANPPSAAERVRDAIGANLADRPRQIFEAALNGRTPEEMAAQFGMTPEQAKVTSGNVLDHVADLMQRRGISAEDAQYALKVRTVPERVGSTAAANPYATPQQSSINPDESTSSPSQDMDLNAIAAHPNDNITLKPLHPPMSETEATAFLAKKALGFDPKQFDIQFREEGANDLEVKAINHDGPATGMVPYDMKLAAGLRTVTMGKTVNGKIPLRLDARLLANSDELRRVTNHEIAEAQYIQKNIEGNFYPDIPNGRRRLTSALAAAHQAGLDAMQ